MVSRKKVLVPSNQDKTKLELDEYKPIDSSGWSYPVLDVPGLSDKMVSDLNTAVNANGACTSWFK